MQKGLQQKVNRKISSDICNVQQILRVRAIQSQQTNRPPNNILQKTGKEGAKNVKIKLEKEEITIITDYKAKANWYASLLMYNSY
jgi:hypothetical protein